MTMWLPTAIYDRAPQFWFLLGLLFMSSGAYLGFEYTMAFVYFGVGVFCVAWSVCIITMRSRIRSREEALLDPDSTQERDGEDAPEQRRDEADG